MFLRPTAIFATVTLLLSGTVAAFQAAAQNPGTPYILAPTTRMVTPAALINTFPTNYDFVYPGDPTSESVHNFEESGGSSTSTATVPGRLLADAEGAWISYTLRVAQNRACVLRIDDVGTPAGAFAYTVQINGVTLHTRTFTRHIGWGKTYGGCESYTLSVAPSFTVSGSIVVRFTKLPGNAPKIAAVWALGSESAPEPSRGGTVSGIAELPAGSATIVSHSSSNGAPYILFDFGVPVCGTFGFSYSSTGPVRVKVARSNSRAYAGIAGDGVHDVAPIGDESRTVDLNGSGTVSYFPPGSVWTFRYVMIMLASAGSVTISNVRMNYEAVPNMSDPAQYPGYFFCSDTALNKVWYAGAYTAQTCTRQYLYDGGKRDRALWGGDLAAAGPTVFLSYGDNASVRDGYKRFFSPGDPWWPGQDPVTGYLNHYSPIYHVMTTMGFAEYFLYTRDTVTLLEYWDAFQRGVAYVTDNLQDGLFNQGGGYFCYSSSPVRSCEVSSYAYRMYVLGAELADYLGETAVAQAWRQTAQTVRNAINNTLWNTSKGAYMHAPGKSQYVSGIGTSLPITYGIATDERAASITRYLTTSMRNSIGYYTIDDAADGMPKTLSPFAGGYILEALFAAGRATEGVEYLKSTWYHMLSSAYGNNATFWETLDLDGTPTYDAYDSYGHCWSSAPTRVLTERVLGVMPLAMGYTRYQVRPVPGSLTRVEGSVPCPGNRQIVVAYTTDNTSTFDMTINSSSYPGSQGTLAIPRFGRVVTVRVNGSVVWDDVFHAFDGIGGAYQDSSYVYLTSVQSGVYAIVSAEAGSVTVPPQAQGVRANARTPGASARAYLLNGALLPRSNAGSGGRGTRYSSSPVVRRTVSGSQEKDISGLSKYE